MLNLRNLRNKRVGVLGLGKTGLSVVNALEQAGALLTCWNDDKEKRKREEASIKKLRKDLNQARRERNEAHDSINEFVKRQKSVHFSSNSASTEESGESSESESEDGGSAGKPKETGRLFFRSSGEMFFKRLS